MGRDEFHRLLNHLPWTNLPEPQETPDLRRQFDLSIGAIGAGAYWRSATSRRCCPSRLVLE